MKPDISVIMSVYNGEAYLESAVESVIGQTFKNWELIVINDCSTDATGEILSSFAKKDARVKVHTNETNLRLPTSLNKAISLSEGKYIARMDADDICLPDRLEKQFRFMEENSDVALSSCRFFTLKNGIYQAGGIGGRCDFESMRAMLLVTNPILHPGVIAKAEVMKELKYDPTHTCTEDMELWTRFSQNNYKIQLLPEYLFIYRLHDKQITSTTLAKQHTEVLIIQERYYGALLEPMSEKMQEFYIGGVYFKEKAEISAFINYAKWLRKQTKKNFSQEAVNYALFEILAEYKRCGVSKKDVLKGMWAFPPIFMIKEMIRRKRAAQSDLNKCMKVAEKIGIRQTAGKKSYPIFEK